MKRITMYPIITILVTVATITVNALANILPFNGQETGEISDRFDILFVPAGYVFSIWGLIYLGLIAFAVYQALPAQKENALIRKISPAYWIGNLANAIWVFLWHYEFFALTLIFMLVLLISLLYIYVQIAREKVEFNQAQKCLVQIPFSVYLGWITVATVANVTQVLFFYNWGGWGIAPAVWAVIMLAVATLIGVLMTWRENDLAYVLVLVWAFVGITVSQADTPLVANTAWAVSGLLVLAAIGLPLIKRSANK